MDALVSRYRPQVVSEVFGQVYQVSQLIKILSRRYGLAPYLIASTPERGTTGKDIPNYCHVSELPSRFTDWVPNHGQRPLLIILFLEAIVETVKHARVGAPRRSNKKSGLHPLERAIGMKLLELLLDQLAGTLYILKKPTTLISCSWRTPAALRCGS